MRSGTRNSAVRSTVSSQTQHEFGMRGASRRARRGPAAPGRPAQKRLPPHRWGRLEQRVALRRLARGPIVGRGG